MNKSSQRRRKRRSKSVIMRNLRKPLRYLPWIAPFLITAFIYAWLYTRINIVGLPIEPLRAQKRDLVKQNESIRLRIEQLQAPARIESIARAKLGMLSPQKWQVVALDEPMQPPDETGGAAQKPGHGLASNRESVRLFGFLKKHGDPGNTLRKHPSPETTEHSG
jgi:cell division protein FtsB